MRRREYVRAIGGATSVTVLGGLAGCSGDGGSGGAAGPFSVTTEGPYYFNADSGIAPVYARLTISKPSQEWPAENHYEGWKRRGTEEGKKRMQVNFDGKLIPNFNLKKSDFENSESISVNALMVKKSALETGTSYTFYLRAPENETFHDVGSVTYQGNSEQRPLEKTPKWAQDK